MVADGRSDLTAVLGAPLKDPAKLNDVAIYIVGLATVLRLVKLLLQHCKGIEDAMNLSWAYKALAEMVSDLGEQIGDYAP